MAITGKDIVKSALRVLGVIGVGETPSANEISDGLSALNRMASSWATENLTIKSMTTESFPLVASQQDYTVGTGGDFDTAKPVALIGATLKTPSGQEIPIEIVSQSEWAAIIQKDLQAPIPIKLLVQGTTPLETISLWPIPNEVNQIVLYSQKALAGFSANTAVDLSEGYELALIFNLAKHLAPEYQRPLTIEANTIANESKAMIKRKNIQPVFMVSDVIGLAGRKTFNILTGE